MDNEQFAKWFIKNIDTMVEMGIMHYRSDKAREIHAILKILYPEINSMNNRINELEKKLNG